MARWRRFPRRFLPWLFQGEDALHRVVAGVVDRIALHMWVWCVCLGLVRRGQALFGCLVQHLDQPPAADSLLAFITRAVKIAAKKAKKKRCSCRDPCLFAASFFCA